MPTTGPATNWAGTITYGAARVHRPATVDALRATVAAADRVRALGTGHSFNRIADTSGDLVRLDGLPKTVRIDAAAGTATVGAGMRYAEIAGPLHAAGFALGSLASLPHITVAGSCATGTHGSGDTRRSLSAAVAGLRIVGADGGVRELSRAADPELLRGAVVALGGLGIVLDVTLDIEPAFDVAQWVYTGLPLDRMAADVDAVFGAAYSVSVFTDWHSGEGVAWLKRRADSDGTGPMPRRWLGAHRAERPHHPLPGVSPVHCTEQLGVPGPWHERLPHFRAAFTPSHGEEVQSELLVPRSAAPEAFAALRRLGPRMAPLLQVAEVRTVAADDLWLSPAYGRDSVALHFTWVKDTAAVLPVVAAVEAELMPLGARPHWAKLTADTPAETAARYDRAADFGALLRSFDPAGKFGNAYTAAF
ncbi:xylitol oxidase [Murinocardiopsis flavida]|uniref:Xylitol oxidase n=1 Tax=Murinocardiopsis flavida TaxID=645275 RepID=A0A2P8DFA8_9ACTN|nr:FAD-binding protein [Murinocardiopsis flavida]PSK95901.1 xylitol oxidase [Murinocardiopsis flavida]